jgi:peptidoglycan L-alanyl-D-glutamate endopeptidase CwlK
MYIIQYCRNSNIVLSLQRDKSGMNVGNGTLGLLGVLLGTFGMLAWTGWRFFVRSAQPQITVPVQLSGARLPSFKPTSLWPFALLIVTAAGVTITVGNIAATTATEPLAALSLDRQAHIHSALDPEKLVPPPPLPAAMFIGTDIPGLENADRNWNRLDPAFMRRALLVFTRMEARGFPMALLEGYRSPERQDALASLGPNVTRARAFQSKHQYGLALDAAPMLNGRLVISERDPWAMQAYQALGEEAEKAGLVWGGRWTLRDYGHIESPERPRGEQAGK